MYVNESKDFLTVNRVLHAIGSRFFAIALFTLLGTAATLALLITLPNVFESQSMLYIKIGRGTVAIDPATSASGSHISLMDSRQTEINSVKEMLSSRVVIERAVQSVGVDRVMEVIPWHEATYKTVRGWMKDQADAINATLTGKTIEEVKDDYADLAPSEVERLEALEEAVERVMEKFTVKTTKDSYTLQLTCRAYSPTLARDICQAIVDEYRKVHVEAHSVRGSLEFFEKQYADAQSRLALLEENLRDTKTRTQMMTVPGKQELVLAEIKQLQTDLLKVSSEVAAARARDAELIAKAEAIPEWLKADETNGVANDASDKMRNQLFELEMLEKDLTNRYTATHPLVVQVREKLVSAKNIYKNQANERTLVKETLNPNRQALELDRFRNLSTLEALKAQQEDLQTKIELAQQKAAQVNADEVLLNSLQREVELARNDSMNYGRKREEARLLDRLDSANLTDVSLPQPPSLVIEKAGPKRLLLTVAAAVCLSVVGSAFAVFFDVRSSNQLAEPTVSAPVVVTNPAVASAADAHTAKAMDKVVQNASNLSPSTATVTKADVSQTTVPQNNTTQVTTTSEAKSKKSDSPWIDV